MSDLQRELELLGEVALAAGRRQLAAWGEVRAIDFKSTVDMVTDLDRAVESFLVAELHRVFPHDSVRAEEGGAVDGDSGRVWHIDPLDGTTNYVHGHPYFCTSLGCVDAEGYVLAAVCAPELDELFLASRGGGARLLRPVRGSERGLGPLRPVPLDRALLGTGFPYARGELVTLICDITRDFLLRNCHGVRRGGSAALDLCHVAAGCLDGYWEVALNPWDIAAGVLIAREAGAVVTDFAGREGELSGAEVLAAAPELHAVMREHLLAVVDGRLPGGKETA